MVQLPSHPTLSHATVGLRRMRVSPQIRSLLNELWKKVLDCEAYYHPVNVCIALNGFQSLDDSVPEVM